jgi:hypothetical protein
VQESSLLGIVLLSQEHQLLSAGLDEDLRDLSSDGSHGTWPLLTGDLGEALISPHLFRDAKTARSPDLHLEGRTGDCHLDLLLGGDGGDLLGHDDAQGIQDIVNCVLGGTVDASSLGSLVVVDFLLCMLMASLGRGGEVGGGERTEGGAGRGSRKPIQLTMLVSKGAIVCLMRLYPVRAV